MRETPKIKKIPQLVVAVAVIITTIFLFKTYYKPSSTAKISFDFPTKISTNQEINVPLRISTNTAINAAEFYFSFPTDLVEAIEIDKSGSFYSLWVKDSPSFDNKTGLLYLAGGLPTPGFKGDNGLVATIKFKVKKSGQGEISLNMDKSRILANDGLGTKIPSPFQPIQFTIE